MAHRTQWIRALVLRQRVGRLLSWVLVLVLWLGWSAPPAYATLNDDHFDGNIFPLYAGNGSLVPPKVTLAEALKRNRPVLLFFYVDDSSDCKQFVSVISRLDAFYGWAADFIPISVDMIPVKASYAPTEPGHYYKGFVPQTVILDASGKVVLDAKGNVAYEEIDDVLRDVFDLLPRSESVELRRRTVNEVTTELVEQGTKASKK
ncbi:MAG: thylakoid membrane photosystem I accumulation factor [Leptolyngbya sp. IPPAS B-1204]|nr:MAG: thioredoxin family protein [Leptolyngbya sp. IPPAS B-1204]